jgi:hypothetical protein
MNGDSGKSIIVYLEASDAKGNTAEDVYACFMRLPSFSA